MLFVKNNIHYKYNDLSKDYHRCQHEYKIYDNENNLIYKYLFNKDTYYDVNSNSILNTSEDFCICFKENYEKIKIVLELHRHNRHGFGNINLEIDKNNNSYIKVDYIEKGISNNSSLISTNTSDIASNSGFISTNSSDIVSNSGLISTNAEAISDNSDLISTNAEAISDNSDLISTNAEAISDNSDLISTNAEAISDNSDLISTNAEAISDNSDLISTNAEAISDNSDLISTNAEAISDNSDLINTNAEAISDNKDDIIALQNSNVKAFYNLDKIFIYDIEKGYQTVNKDNHYHIFEKEIYYNFVKNSYLEIILKVLTKISHYVLIGFFQILCNFYDENDDLFYTISLSTAMGSINKLSTIKSVFIVPINKNMTKIKIDFFIMPKPTQESRSANFTIKDINSNKIYIKYFQKTDEMSIKNIQDSLNNVNNFASKIDNLEKSLYLKIFLMNYITT